MTDDDGSWKEIQSIQDVSDGREDRKARQSPHNEPSLSQLFESIAEPSILHLSHESAERTTPHALRHLTRPEEEVFETPDTRLTADTSYTFGPGKEPGLEGIEKGSVKSEVERLEGHSTHSQSPRVWKGSQAEKEQSAYVPWTRMPVDDIEALYGNDGNVEKDKGNAERYDVHSDEGNKNEGIEKENNGYKEPDVTSPLREEETSLLPLERSPMIDMDERKLWGSFESGRVATGLVIPWCPFEHKGEECVWKDVGLCHFRHKVAGESVGESLGEPIVDRSPKKPKRTQQSPKKPQSPKEKQQDPKAKQLAKAKLAQNPGFPKAKVKGKQPSLSLASLPTFEELGPQDNAWRGEREQPPPPPSQPALPPSKAYPKSRSSKLTPGEPKAPAPPIPEPPTPFPRMEKLGAPSAPVKAKDSDSGLGRPPHTGVPTRPPVRRQTDAERQFEQIENDHEVALRMQEEEQANEGERAIVWPQPTAGFTEVKNKDEIRKEKKAKSMLEQRKAKVALEERSARVAAEKAEAARVRMKLRREESEERKALQLQKDREEADAAEAERLRIEKQREWDAWDMKQAREREKEIRDARLKLREEQASDQAEEVLVKAAAAQGARIRLVAKEEAARIEREAVEKLMVEKDLQREAEAGARAEAERKREAMVAARVIEIQEAKTEQERKEAEYIAEREARFRKAAADRAEREEAENEAHEKGMDVARDEWDAAERENEEVRSANPEYVIERERKAKEAEEARRAWIDEGIAELDAEAREAADMAGWKERKVAAAKAAKEAWVADGIAREEAARRKHRVDANDAEVRKAANIVYEERDFTPAQKRAAKIARERASQRAGGAKQDALGFTSSCVMIGEQGVEFSVLMPEAEPPGGVPMWEPLTGEDSLAEGRQPYAPKENAIAARRRLEQAERDSLRIMTIQEERVKAEQKREADVALEARLEAARVRDAELVRGAEREAVARVEAAAREEARAAAARDEAQAAEAARAEEEAREEARKAARSQPSEPPEPSEPDDQSYTSLDTIKFDTEVPPKFLRCINLARVRIVLFGFNFTSHKVVDALLAAHKRGVNVTVAVSLQLALDITTGVSVQRAMDRLEEVGISTYLGAGVLCNNCAREGCVSCWHYKCLLVDPGEESGKLVVGSPNPSWVTMSGLDREGNAATREVAIFTGNKHMIRKCHNFVNCELAVCTDYAGWDGEPFGVHETAPHANLDYARKTAETEAALAELRAQGQNPGAAPFAPASGNVSPVVQKGSHQDSRLGVHSGVPSPVAGTPEFGGERTRGAAGQEAGPKEPGIEEVAASPEFSPVHPVGGAGGANQPPSRPDDADGGESQRAMVAALMAQTQLLTQLVQEGQARAVAAAARFPIKVGNRRCEPKALPVKSSDPAEAMLQFDEIERDLESWIRGISPEMYSKDQSCVKDFFKIGDEIFQPWLKAFTYDRNSIEIGKLVLEALTEAGERFKGLDVVASQVLEWWTSLMNQDFIIAVKEMCVSWKLPILGEFVYTLLRIRMLYDITDPRVRDSVANDVLTKVKTFSGLCQLSLKRWRRLVLRFERLGYDNKHAYQLGTSRWSEAFDRYLVGLPFDRRRPLEKRWLDVLEQREDWWVVSKDSDNVVLDFIENNIPPDVPVALKTDGVTEVKEKELLATTGKATPATPAVSPSKGGESGNCRFGLKCRGLKKGKCKFAHPAIAAVVETVPAPEVLPTVAPMVVVPAPPPVVEAGKGADKGGRSKRAEKRERAIAAAAAKLVANQQGVPPVPENVVKAQLKDMLCRFFRVNGVCKAGSSCPRKHDDEDRRSWLTGIKSGTIQLCRQHQEGKCAYGDLCYLRHPERDARLVAAMVAYAQGLWNEDVKYAAQLAERMHQELGDHRAKHAAQLAERMHQELGDHHAAPAPDDTDTGEEDAWGVMDPDGLFEPDVAHEGEEDLVATVRDSHSVDEEDPLGLWGDWQPPVETPPDEEEPPPPPPPPPREEGIAEWHRYAGLHIPAPGTVPPPGDFLEDEWDEDERDVGRVLPVVHLGDVFGGERSTDASSSSGGAVRNLRNLLEGNAPEHTPRLIGYTEDGPVELRAVLDLDGNLISGSLDEQADALEVGFAFPGGLPADRALEDTPTETNCRRCGVIYPTHELEGNALPNEVDQLVCKGCRSPLFWKMCGTVIADEEPNSFAAYMRQGLLPEDWIEEPWVASLFPPWKPKVRTPLKVKATPKKWVEPTVLEMTAKAIAEAMSSAGPAVLETDLASVYLRSDVDELVWGPPVPYHLLPPPPAPKMKAPPKKKEAPAEAAVKEVAFECGSVVFLKGHSEPRLEGGTGGRIERMTCICRGSPSHVPGPLCVDWVHKEGQATVEQGIREAAEKIERTSDEVFREACSLAWQPWTEELAQTVRERREMDPHGFSMFMQQALVRGEVVKAPKARGVAGGSARKSGREFLRSWSAVEESAPETVMPGKPARRSEGKKTRRRVIGRWARVVGLTLPLRRELDWDLEESVPEVVVRSWGVNPETTPADWGGDVLAADEEAIRSVETAAENPIREYVRPDRRGSSVDDFGEKKASPMRCAFAAWDQWWFAQRRERRLFHHAADRRRLRGAFVGWVVFAADRRRLKGVFVGWVVWTLLQRETPIEDRLVRDYACPTMDIVLSHHAEDVKTLYPGRKVETFLSDGGANNLVVDEGSFFLATQGCLGKLKGVTGACQMKTAAVKNPMAARDERGFTGKGVTQLLPRGMCGCAGEIVQVNCLTGQVNLSQLLLFPEGQSEPMWVLLRLYANLGWLDFDVETTPSWPLNPRRKEPWTFEDAKALKGFLGVYAQGELGPPYVVCEIPDLVSSCGHLDDVVTEGDVFRLERELPCGYCRRPLGEESIGDICLHCGQADALEVGIVDEVLAEKVRKKGPRVEPVSREAERWIRGRISDLACGCPVKRLKVRDMGDKVASEDGEGMERLRGLETESSESDSEVSELVPREIVFAGIEGGRSRPWEVVRSELPLLPEPTGANLQRALAAQGSDEVVVTEGMVSMITRDVDGKSWCCTKCGAHPTSAIDLSQHLKSDKHLRRCGAEMVVANVTEACQYPAVVALSMEIEKRVSEFGSACVEDLVNVLAEQVEEPPRERRHDRCRWLTEAGEKLHWYFKPSDIKLLEKSVSMLECDVDCMRCVKCEKKMFGIADVRSHVRGRGHCLVLEEYLESERQRDAVYMAETHRLQQERYAALSESEEETLHVVAALYGMEESERHVEEFVEMGDELAKVFEAIRRPRKLAKTFSERVPLEWQHKLRHRPADGTCGHACDFGMAKRAGMLKRITLERAIDPDETMIDVDIITSLPQGFGLRGEVCDVLLAARLRRSYAVVGELSDYPWLELTEEYYMYDTHQSLAMICGPKFCEPMQSRETHKITDAVHHAREEFGIEMKRTVIHSDREPGIEDSAGFEAYRQVNQVRCVYGLPRESNTNAHAEGNAKDIKEGGGAVHYGGGLWDEYSFFADHCYTVVDNAAFGWEPRVNTVPKVLVTGQAGVCASTLYVGQSKERVVRGTAVTFLTYDLKGSGGVIVMYLRDDANGNPQRRIAIVKARHVRWARQMSHRRERVGNRLVVRENVVPGGAYLFPGVAGCEQYPSDLRIDTSISRYVVMSKLAEVLHELRVTASMEPDAGSKERLEAGLDDIEQGLYDERYGHTDFVWEALRFCGRKLWTEEGVKKGSPKWRAGKRFAQRVTGLREAMKGRGKHPRLAEDESLPMMTFLTFEEVDFVRDGEHVYVLDGGEGGARYACVTRKLTKAEKSSGGAREAMQVEFDAMNYQFDSWKRLPVDRTTIPPDAVVYKVFKLQEVKHAEEGPDKQRYKGRICVIGCSPYGRSGELLAKVPGMKTYAPVAKQTSVRAVFANAAVRAFGRLGNCGETCAEEEWPPLQTDYKNFYLTSKVLRPGKIFLDLSELLELMSEEERVMHARCVRPVYEVEKGIYGHPEAGRGAILEARDFAESEMPELKRQLADAALYLDESHQTGPTMLVTYSDDSNRSGPKLVKERFLEVMGRKYPLKVEAGRGMIGMKIQREWVDADGMFHYVLCNPEHVDKIVEDFEKGCGQTIPEAQEPLTLDILVEEWEELIELEAYEHSAIAAGCWRYRCDRPCDGYAVTSFASVLHRWSPQARAQLIVFIGWLKRTRLYGVEFTVHPDSVWEELESHLFGDANLQYPQSHAQYDYVLADEHGTLLPLYWRSYKQTLPTTRVKDSEGVTLNDAVDDVLLWTVSLGLRDERLRAWCDNFGVLQWIWGESEEEEFTAAAIGLRRCKLQHLAETGRVIFEHVRSEVNPSNLGTKLIVTKMKLRFEDQSMMMHENGIEQASEKVRQDRWWLMEMIRERRSRPKGRGLHLVQDAPMLRK